MKNVGRNSWGSDSDIDIVSPDPDTDRVRVRVAARIRSLVVSQSRSLVVVARVRQSRRRVVSLRSEPNAGVTNSFRKWKCARNAEGARQANEIY